LSVLSCQLLWSPATDNGPPTTDPSSNRKSQIANRKLPIPPGFTLLEMLTTVAVLVIVLGLMVSLARYVRNASAVEMTKDLLHKLDGMMQQYRLNHADGAGHPGPLPNVTAFLPPDLKSSQLPDEQTLQQRAVDNNRSFMQALRAEGLLSEESFGKLPQSIYSNDLLRDAWGSPIVFMPDSHEGIGMALEGRPFFFSAGPDQQYRTQENNLYSYEK